MWEVESQEIKRGTTRTVLTAAGKPLAFGEAIRLWRESDEFGRYFTALLAGSSFTAFFWETPPVTQQTLDRPFEFVLIDAPSLATVRPDRTSFREHFSLRGAKTVLRFPNLGGDATLVVPAPVAQDSVYTHLASFVRSGPPAQQAEFWRCVAEAMAERASNSPVWLSTAGLGVSWLHLRIDSRPKYYRHEAYKTFG
jgi:hypothetical protein